MTDLDVSLRLRLEYQKRNAEQAERDIKEIKQAVDQLGRSRGGDQLAGDIQKIGRSADQAKGKIDGVQQEAQQLRSALGRVDAEAFQGLQSKANTAKAALSGITQEANQVRAAIGRVDDGAFAALKSSAASAEQAVKQIGAAADATDQKLKNLRTGFPGGPSGYMTPGAPYRPGPFRPSGSWATTAEGMVDQFGMPVAVGAGAAYLAGALPAAGFVAGGAAVNAAGKDEFTSDQLRVLGQYGPEDQARYDKMMAAIGTRKGVGTSGAQSVFGLLMSGGLDADSAAAMTEGAIVFGKATQASPDDAARTTIALKNTFGIGADQMMAAYDAMALGGKEGQFEVPDMAKNFPSIASKMSALGEGGMDGTRLAVALGQAIRKTAGSSDEASTNFENMLGKFRSQDFIKNAKEYGIDVQKTLTGAEAAGESPIIALLDVIKKKVGTDGFKLAKLMPDVQSLAGLEASLNDLDEVKAMIERMKKAEGTVSQDYTDATDNFSSQKDRLGANVGQNIKDTASPLLPALTSLARTLSAALERYRENQEKNPLLNMPIAGEAQPLLKFWTDKGTEDRPSTWDRFWYGKAADPDFSFRQHYQGGLSGAAGESEPGTAAPESGDLGRSTGAIAPPTKRPGPMPTPRPEDLSGVAIQSMNSYRDALATEGKKAEAEAQGIADRIRAIFGFTVSPTIAPTFVAPGAAPAPSAGPPATEKHSSLSPTTTNTFNQTITSPNSKMAAVRSRRENARSVRRAQARSLYDIGRSLA